jgi:hypothetical protein
MPAYTCLYPTSFITGAHTDITDVANVYRYHHSGCTYDGVHSIYYP